MLRSVISYGVSPELTRAPSTTFLAVTTPEIGDTKVSVFDACRVRSSRSIS